MIPASTPAPTPRTDAFMATDPSIGYVQVLAETLERELTHALASLASAQAECVAKDEALRHIKRYSDPKDGHDVQRISIIATEALADNCAAEWPAKLDRRTKALERIKKMVTGDASSNGWPHDFKVTINRGIMADVCDEALEDQ